MRDSILLFVNGRRHEVTGTDLFVPLVEFLRNRLGLVGTKVVCCEGDCGACSVLVGRFQGELPQDGIKPVDRANRVTPSEAISKPSLEYRVVNSCIQFVFQLDGSHVVTVEGLKSNGRLSPVQEAMVRCHGSQCGFCTPGFAVAMTGLFETGHQVDERLLRDSLIGNLCRCTGYSPIIEAGLELNGQQGGRLNDLYLAEPMIREFERVAGKDVTVSHRHAGRSRLFYSPTELPNALGFLAKHPSSKIVAGATDLGVQMNKGQIEPDVILDLGRVAGLADVAIDNGVLVAGARASWSDVERAARDAVPQFHQILTRFGSPQIRHVATIGGNVANASPIADSLPFLYVMEAELDLENTSGSRSVNINEFYLGYKQMDLRPGELITQIRIPLPNESHILRLYKVSKRHDLDIASFTAAILIELDDETISSAAVAFGAVGPTVIRARETEAFLTGQAFNEQTMQAAGDVAVTEISPISDVRGSKQFRYQLTRNVLVKFFHEAIPEQAFNTAPF